MIPIFKKGNQQDFNNYRPISLLSNIGKIIKKVIHKRLFQFLNNNNCLFNYQLGFRNHHSTKHGAPQGSVLGPLLFLIYINNLNIVTYYDIHHFEDDINLLYPSKSIKDINRKVNFDLKIIIYWLRAKKISFNADKTELILFRSKNRVTTKLDQCSKNSSIDPNKVPRNNSR